MGLKFTYDVLVISIHMQICYIFKILIELKTKTVPFRKFEMVIQIQK